MCLEILFLLSFRSKSRPRIPKVRRNTITGSSPRSFPTPAPAGCRRPDIAHRNESL